MFTAFIMIGVLGPRINAIRPSNRIGRLAPQPLIEPTAAKRHVASINTCCASRVFYLLTLALMLALMPWTVVGAGESPFVRVMRTVHIPAAAGIVNFVILVAALSAMNSTLYASTRMMFSLSRAGQAPGRFGKLTRRSVPLQALLLSSSGVAVAAVLGVISPGRAYLVMLSVSGFGVMFVWLMIFVTHYFFRRARAGEPAARFRIWGYPFSTLLGAGLMASVLITTLFDEPFRLTLVFGLPFLGLLAAIYYLWYRSCASAQRRALLRSRLRGRTRRLSPSSGKRPTIRRR